MSSTTVPTVPDSPGAHRAPAPEGPARRAWTPSAVAVRRILIANLVAQVVIVLTGGVVRLTGSGLGCSTWPECEPGQFTPVAHEAASWHPFIEFGNRTLTGVLLVLALATAWVVWHQADRSRALRWLGLAPLALVVTQAVLGGILVLLGLPPALVGLHFLVSMALVAVSAALVHRLAEGDGPAHRLVGPRTSTLARALAPLSVVVLTLGVVVTGAGPHSGDDEVGYRLALDPAEMARVHSASVWLFVAGVLALVVAVRRAGAPATVTRAAATLLAVTLGQGLIGYVQYLTDLPAALVAAHMVGAALLVIAQVHLLLALRRREPVPAAAQ